MLNGMAALLHKDTMPQRLADAHCSSAMQQCCQYRRMLDMDAK